MTVFSVLVLFSASASFVGCASASSSSDGAHAGAAVSPDGSPAGSGSWSGSGSDSGTASGSGSSSASGRLASSGASTGGGSGSTSGALGDDSGTVGAPDSSTEQDATAARESGVAGPLGDAGARPHTGAWRIMPLGDSITGTMCPPQLLSQQLKSAGRSNFVFVGSNLNNQSCYGAPNVQTEGHGGYLVTDLVGSHQHAAQLPQWCSADMADVVLMMFGTNDAWNSRSTQSILDAYAVVLTDLRAVNPHVILFVAQITPLNPAGCANCEANVEALNARIPGWASAQSTAASPVYSVDVHSAFTASAYVPNSTYTRDGVHPTPAGSKLIADKWYNALVAQGLP